MEAQDSIPPRNEAIARKRVAVVLSGGGAKGMAHIGVLKVIERAGIPIDIVTGTSMGSIVGGLYSCGWTAHKLDSIVRLQDWAFLLSDRDDYYSQSLKDRKRQSTYILTKRFNAKKNNLSEKGGFISGKNLYKLFNQLTYGYTDSMDFNKLPIPFACVATNIIDNTEYDFHSGILAQAMRTSMSIPGVFSPVEKNGMVLVDGGLRNNYPADIARQMGADYIIGATVQGKPKTADDLKNSTDVLGQIVDVNCKNKYDDNLAITDIPIRVNTSGYSAASFTPAAIDTLIRRGEIEAMKHWDELIALKRKLGYADDYQPKPYDLHPEALAAVDFSKQDSVSRPKNDVIEGALGVRFDTEEIVAMQLNGIYKSSHKPVDLEATLRLGKRIMGAAQLTWIPKKHTEVSLEYVFRHNEINFYNEGHKDFNITYNNHKASLGLSNLRLRNLQLDLSVNWDYYNFNQILIARKFSNTNLEIHDNHFYSYQAYLHYNSENQAVFPTRGALFNARYGYFTDNFSEYNGHRGFSEVNGLWRMSFALSHRLTFQPMLYGRMLFGKEIPITRANHIGGMWTGHYTDQQMPFAGIGHVEFTKRHFLGCQLKLQERLTTNNFLILKGVIAQTAEDLDDLLKTSTKLGYQLGYFYRTLLGPIGATLGYSNITDRVDFYINFGFEF